MKRFTPCLSALLAALACVAAPAMAAPDVGVSVHVGQPGVYGRIDLGRVPPPVVVYAQPIVVQPPPRVVTAPPPQPVYLWVPPGHQKQWSKHCGRYDACGVPVYFVQDRWYREHVMAGRGAPPQPQGRPAYAGGGATYALHPGHDQGSGGDDRDPGHKGKKYKDKDKDKDDREHGEGHGHKGKGKGD